MQNKEMAVKAALCSLTTKTNLFHIASLSMKESVESVEKEI